MCRITGIINKFAQLGSEENIQRMLSSMVHGGPDDEGIFTDENSKVFLGHRRLSIIDLSKSGHQPMYSENQEIVIVFNGEIYNYLELKGILIAKGYNFNSSTDTEVIINSFKEWGTDSFHKLNGMFAFCLYDIRKRKIYLVRDHAAIKPLYYYIDKNKLIFSSEIRAFYKYDPRWEENHDWKILFLTFGFIPFPYTTLNKVYSLPKASFLTLDLQSFNYVISSYANYKYSSLITSEDEAIELVRKSMFDVVKRQLLSDAPIGIFLSGGIDSSLLALIANKLDNVNLNTLSITFKEANFSEEIYQKKVTDKINTCHTSFCVDESMFLESFTDILKAMDQPSQDGINSYFVSKCAKNIGLKAVLSGIGADEYFGGYPSFERTNILKFSNCIPNLFLKLISEAGNDKLERFNFLKIPHSVGHYLFLRGIHVPSQVAEILECSEDEVMEKLKRLNYTDAPTKIDKNYASFLESNIYMENQLLKDTDYMSMWHSLEVRVPFLDKDLVKLMMEVSPSVKFNPERIKFLLTKTFEDLLPREIVYRKKQGFTFPFSIWIKNNMNTFEQSLPLKNKSINDLKEKVIKNKVHWSKFWTVYVAANFNILKYRT